MDILRDAPVLENLQQMVRGFATHAMRPIAAEHDREETMPWELMKRAAAMGFSQTALLDAAEGKSPLGGASRGSAAAGSSDGGQKKRAPLDARLACIAAEELGWGCAGIGLALVGSNLATAPILSLGSDEQKKFYRECLSGETEDGRVKVSAMALTEPGAGSDISSIGTRARKDGDHWVLTGQKQWITNGQSASVYLVWAQTDPDRGRAGVRGFIVPRSAEGLTPGKKERKLGIRASETAQVHLEDCRVPEELMLAAKKSAGLGDTKKMLDSTRPMVGAQAVGIARAAFEHVRDMVRQGSFRGTPSAGHQAIAFTIAEMEMEIRASRLLVHRAAWMADHGLENVRFASMAKAHAARTAQWVTCRALTLCGEDALEEGHPVDKWYRDAKIYDIFEGTGQIQRRIIARDLLGVNAV